MWKNENGEYVTDAGVNFGDNMEYAAAYEEGMRNAGKGGNELGDLTLAAIDGVTNWIVGAIEKSAAASAEYERMFPIIKEKATATIKPVFEEAEKCFKAQDWKQAIKDYEFAASILYKIWNGWDLWYLHDDKFYYPSDYTDHILLGLAQCYFHVKEYRKANDKWDNAKADGVLKRKDVCALYFLMGENNFKLMEEQVADSRKRSKESAEGWYEAAIEKNGSKSAEAKEALARLQKVDTEYNAKAGIQPEAIKGGNEKLPLILGIAGAVVFGIFGIVTSKGSLGVLGFILGAAFGFGAGFFIGRKINDKIQARPNVELTEEEAAKVLKLVEGFTATQIYRAAKDETEFGEYAWPSVLYKKATEMGGGDAEACNGLAEYYWYGNESLHIKKDQTKAISLYEKALEQGIPYNLEYIHTRLGQAYMDGINGVQQDKEKAKRFFTFVVEKTDDWQGIAAKALKKL